MKKGGCVVYITVVIISHKRDTFLKNAVNSILNQSINRSKYEIILVKDFNSDVDSWLRKHRVKLLYVPGKKIGPKLFNALRYSHGEIISFLDDDDIFLSGKLNKVYSIFKENKNLGYYRNNFVTINKKGKLVNTHFLEYSRNKIKKMRKFFVLDNQKHKLVKDMLDVNFDSLPSCISIRKNILLDNIKYLKKIDLEQDWFSFYSTLASKYDMLCDNSRLTGYRIHDKNTSISKNLSDKIKFNNRAIYSYNIIITMLKEKRNYLYYNFAKANLIGYEMENSILRKDKKARVLYLISKFWLYRFRFVYFHRYKFTIKILILLFLIILNYKYGRKIYIKQSTPIL